MTEYDTFIFFTVYEKIEQTEENFGKGMSQILFFRVFFLLERHFVQ